MADRYELLYLVSAQISETDLPPITGRVTELITKLGGQIVKDELWGKRKLTYQINRDTNAYYWLTQFDTIAPINAALTEQLNLQPEIIRVLITEALPDSETIPMEQARQEAAARQEERVAQAEAAKPVADTESVRPGFQPSIDPLLDSTGTEVPDLASDTAQPTEPAREEKRIDLDELDRKLDEILDDKVSDK